MDHVFGECTVDTAVERRFGVEASSSSGGQPRLGDVYPSSRSIVSTAKRVSPAADINSAVAPPTGPASA